MESGSQAHTESQTWWADGVGLTLLGFRLDFFFFFQINNLIEIGCRIGN